MLFPDRNFRWIYSWPLPIHAETLCCLTLFTWLIRRNRLMQRLNYYRECLVSEPLYRISPRINTWNYSWFQTTTDNIWLKLSAIYHKLVTDHYYSRNINSLKFTILYFSVFYSGNVMVITVFFYDNRWRSFWPSSDSNSLPHTFRW